MLVLYWLNSVKCCSTFQIKPQAILNGLHGLVRGKRNSSRIPLVLSLYIPFASSHPALPLVQLLPGRVKANDCFLWDEWRAKVQLSASFRASAHEASQRRNTRTENLRVCNPTQRAWSISNSLTPGCFSLGIQTTNLWMIVVRISCYWCIWLDN